MNEKNTEIKNFMIIFNPSGEASQMFNGNASATSFPLHIHPALVLIFLLVLAR
jgi:hypothetical protein